MEKTKKAEAEKKQERKFKVDEGRLIATVRSSKKDKFYEVRKIEEGVWTCSCMAYRFTKGPVGKKLPCKHMVRVFEEVKKDVVGLSADVRIFQLEK